VIFGKLPPPIGGVTRHIQRLQEHLEHDNIKFISIDRSVIAICKALFQYDVFHIHFSNAIAQYLITTVASVLSKTTILTIHRDLDRYRGVRKWMNRKSINLSTLPIVLNARSLEIARSFHSGAERLTSFIPPTEIGDLKECYHNKIVKLRNRAKHVFCTNAYDFAIDNNENEIYQISTLVKLFSNLPEVGLIISDPSGHNYTYCQCNNVTISENILFITEPHDFIPVLKLSDTLIRCTTTDGDSISVREALYFQKPVIASDVTDRPEGCTLFDMSDTEALKNIIVSFNQTPRDINKQENAYHRLKEIYQAYGVNT